MEKIMLDIMFKLPSMPDVRECLINRGVIEKGKPPLLFYGDADVIRADEEDKAS
jgi:ATP-dependent Clp protease ATP-binding subunit ClpX